MELSRKRGWLDIPGTIQDVEFNITLWLFLSFFNRPGVAGAVLQTPPSLIN